MHTRSFPPAYMAMKEEVTWPLYDYQPVRPGGDSQMDFFQRPLGSQVEGFGVRGLTSTNMYKAHQLPEHNAFYMTGLRVLFFPDFVQLRGNVKQDAQDIARVMLSGVLSFEIGDRLYLRDGPMCKFPACFPTYFGNLKPDQRLTSWMKRGRYIEVAQQAYKAIVPVYIQDHLMFRVRIHELNTDLHAPGRIGVILDGLLVRMPS